MAAKIDLRATDRVEILTLQDNYIDLVALDSNEIVQRAMPLKDGEIKNSILAEHGFSALITINPAGAARSLLFDFGFSEQGAPNLFYEEDGIEKHDLIEDDTAIAFNLKDRGLVIISGCAHSGIVNTIIHAIDVTGVERVWAIMGGFHLSGADVDTVIQPTVDALKQLKPHYIIPVHCTGRQAVLEIEKQMPECFIVNMAGTKLTFKTG